jgi:hypothetical protein
MPTTYTEDDQTFGDVTCIGCKCATLVTLGVDGSRGRVTFR